MSIEKNGIHGVQYSYPLKWGMWREVFCNIYQFFSNLNIVKDLVSFLDNLTCSLYCRALHDVFIILWTRSREGKEREWAASAMRARVGRGQQTFFIHWRLSIYIVDPVIGPFFLIVMIVLVTVKHWVVNHTGTYHLYRSWNTYICNMINLAFHHWSRKILRCGWPGFFF